MKNNAAFGQVHVGVSENLVQPFHGMVGVELRHQHMPLLSVHIPAARCYDTNRILS